MSNWPPYHIFPLGDSAITLDFGNIIDASINKNVISLFHFLKKEPLPSMIEAVPAYSSVTIYYDLFQLRKKVPETKSVCDWMIEQLENKVQDHFSSGDILSRQIKIPVCYEKEFAIDIEEISAKKNIPIDEIIQIHTSIAYRVYMLGFLPGFSYMGLVDERIEIPRRAQPRQRVEAGSVGIAGRQTGIYPLASPGGWQIIGRTPMKLFDASRNEQTLVQAGDEVQFYPISFEEFKTLGEK